MIHKAYNPIPNPTVTRCLRTLQRPFIYLVNVRTKREQSPRLHSPSLCLYPPLTPTHLPPPSQKKQQNPKTGPPLHAADAPALPRRRRRPPLPRRRPLPAQAPPPRCLHRRRRCRCCWRARHGGGRRRGAAGAGGSGVWGPACHGAGVDGGRRRLGPPAAAVRAFVCLFFVLGEGTVGGGRLASFFGEGFID